MKSMTIISLIEVEGSLMKSIDEKTLESFKVLTRQASTILWIGVGDQLGTLRPNLSLVTRLVRSLVAEQVGLTFLMLDIPSSELFENSTASNIVMTLDQSLAQDFEFVQRHEALHITRFVPDRQTNAMFNKLRDQREWYSPPYQTVLSSAKTYIIAGGLGGLGTSIAEWMLECGARRIILVCRSKPDHLKVEYWKAIEKHWNAILNYKYSWHRAHHIPSIESNRWDCTRSDGSQDWHTVIATKVQGAWNLHFALLTNDKPVDFFLLTSSISSTIGQIAQGNYCAANNFLDHFARYRRQLGLPAVSVALGPVLDVGYLADNPEAERLLTRTGISTLDEEDVRCIIDLAITQSLQAPQSLTPTGSNCTPRSNDKESTSNWDDLKGTTTIGLLQRLSYMLGGGDNNLLTSSSCFSSSLLLTGLENVTDPSFDWSSPTNAVARDPRTCLLRANFSTSLSKSTTNSEPGRNSALPGSIQELVDTGVDLHDAIAAAVRDGIARILGIREPGEVDLNRTLVAYGVDSMIATEIKGWLMAELGFEMGLIEMLGPEGRIGVIIERMLRRMGEECDISG